MAVFMVNICKFNGCGITFQSLGDLIQHIEDTHIDYDPTVVERQEKQQPPCLPLSYVLRFFTDAARRDLPDIKQMTTTKDAAILHRPSSPSGSDAEDNEAISDSEDSNDSWTTTEEFSSEFILRYGSRMVQWNPNQPDVNAEKPFACPVPGCKKRYKNVNGIKYHSKNGHKNVGKVRKGYKCHCGKSYKTAQGLKVHTAAQHAGASLTALLQAVKQPLQQPLRTVTLKPLPVTLPVKTIQGLVLSTKSIENGATRVKGSLIDLTSLGSETSSNVSSCGLLVNVSGSSHTAPPGTSTALSMGMGMGILTPASSPRTSPSTPEGLGLNVQRICLSVPTSPSSASSASLPLTPPSLNAVVEMQVSS